MHYHSLTMASPSPPCVDMEDPVADLVLRPTWYIDRHGVRHYRGTAFVPSGCRSCRVLRSPLWTVSTGVGSSLLDTTPDLGPLASIYAIRGLTFSETPGHPNRFHDLTRALQLPLQVVGEHYANEFHGLLNSSPVMRNLPGTVVIHLFPEVSDEGRFHYHGLITAPPAGRGAADAAQWVSHAMARRWGHASVQRIRGEGGLAKWLEYMQKDAGVLPELPAQVYRCTGLGGGDPWMPSPDEVAAQLEECRLDVPLPVDAVPPSTVPHAWALSASSPVATSWRTASARSSAFNPSDGGPYA